MVASRAVPFVVQGCFAAHPAWSRVLTSPEPGARLLLPVVVSAVVEDRELVDGAPGGSRIERVSLTELVRDARAALHAGIGGLLILGATDRKDEHALLASERDHIVVRAIRAVKQAVPELAIATDVCVCPHTSHGQCVLFNAGAADVDGTHRRLSEIAVVHADAGADLIIPSGMLDGSAGAIRAALDDADHRSVPVAAMLDVESALGALDRRVIGALQIAERAVPLLPRDPAGATLARARRDVAAGADAAVVRPGVALDVISLVTHELGIPTIAYHRADDHALAVAAGEGTVDAAAAEYEAVLASRRAGASLVVTFGAWAVAEAIAA